MKKFFNFIFKSMMYFGLVLIFIRITFEIILIFKEKSILGLGNSPIDVQFAFLLLLFAGTFWLTIGGIGWALTNPREFIDGIKFMVKWDGED